MLLDAVGKIRRQSILTAIVLIVLGVIMLLCPEKHIGTLVTVAGYGMIIFSMEQCLEFLTGNRTVINYIVFVIALIVGLGGLAVLVYHDNVLKGLCWVCGLFILLDGAHSCYYACTFARRADRKGWSLLVIMSIILMLLGLMVLVGIVYFLNSWLESPLFLMKILGIAILFSALISAIRLIWIKPVKSGGEE